MVKKRTQRRINPPGQSKNDGVSAASGPVTVKIAITTQSKMTLRLIPKATTAIGTQ